MFNKNNRYMTRGIKETLDISLQMILWKMVDDLKESKEIELDYLQVFKIRRNNEELIMQSIPYEEQSMERLAINEGTKIAQKFDDMFDNIVRFFER